MTEEKKPEYRVVEDYRTQEAQKQLNALAVEGYEVIAVTPAEDDDMERHWTIWTLRLRRELRTPANVPLLATVAASLIELQQRVENLAEVMHAVHSQQESALEEMRERTIRR